ncbi:hypothetical protein CEXT_688711 [Caerostris extrusa]|uniref:Uncharacterized protein n=1 Tax=Caerostris extrusa TaxID=172846 RepID=A0AAV4PSD8_CAEEX|nr:hypothetical protein CEXT_688711 [Caerostris extrusa]
MKIQKKKVSQREKKRKKNSISDCTIPLSRIERNYHGDGRADNLLPAVGNGREAIEMALGKELFLSPFFPVSFRNPGTCWPDTFGMFLCTGMDHARFLCHHTEKYEYSSSYCRTHSLPQPFQKIRKSFTR